jgi:hypothetical protein
LKETVQVVPLAEATLSSDTSSVEEAVNGAASRLNLRACASEVED